MTLTLSIRNVAQLDNGAPTEFVLHRRGAVVGRSPTCDWSLPDPRNYISSRHLEIRFDGQSYAVIDTSTNGTFLNGASERMGGPRRVMDGDRFQIGHYDIRAALTGESYDDPGQNDGGAGASQSQWRGWDDKAPPVQSSPAQDGFAGAPTPSSSGWDDVPPPTDGGRWQPQTGPSLARPDPHRDTGRPSAPSAPIGSGWAPDHRVPDPPVSSAWQSAAPPDDPASDWSSAAPNRPAPPSPDDIWGRLAEGNVVDWARGGFGQPSQVERDPLGLDPAPAREALPAKRPSPPSGDWSEPAPTSSRVKAREAASVAPRFAAGAGLSPQQIGAFTPADLEQAGALFRRLVAGLVVMVEARARAKAQLGAETTAFNPAGNNPIKFARTPDEALAMLLNPPQQGFMPADRAIEDAFLELQSHQMATLRAMQGALKATLDRFSPTAIRARAESKGLLERIVPAARDAALWQAYDREFSGVAQGSDEAFMDVFAKEFRNAYNEQARGDRR